MAAAANRVYAIGICWYSARGIKSAPLGETNNHGLRTKLAIAFAERAHHS